MINNKTIEPFFSIIIPAFNVSKYISQSLKSTVNQTYNNIEIIIIDDNSTDGTADLVSLFAKNDPRILFIRNKENKSQNYSRKKGVELAKGDYILFLDSDDELELNACESLYNAIFSETKDIIEFSYTCIPNGNIVHAPYNERADRLALILQESGPTIQSLWNKAYRADKLKKAFHFIQPKRLVCGEDIYQSTVIARHLTSIKIIDTPLYKYRTGIGVSSRKQLSFKETTGYIDSLVLVMNMVTQYIKIHAIEYEKYLTGFQQHIINDSLYGHVFERTNENDIGKAFLYLLKTFPENIIENELFKIYTILQTPTNDRPSLIFKILRKAKKILVRNRIKK